MCNNLKATTGVVSRHTKNLQGTTAISYCQCTAVTLTGPADTAVFLLSIIIPGLNHHLTQDLPLLLLRRAMFARVSDDRKSKTQWKDDLCSNLSPISLKDRPNYYKWRAAKAGTTCERSATCLRAHISFWFCSFMLLRPWRWEQRRSSTIHSWKVIEDGALGVSMGEGVERRVGPFLMSVNIKPSSEMSIHRHLKGDEGGKRVVWSHLQKKTRTD